MVDNKYRFTKIACQSSYMTMTAAFVLPPLLFTTFNKLYGVSYTLLGTLVLVNFCTQLSIDLIFSFFNRFFNKKICARLMPVFTSVGLVFYACSPWIFANNVYIGLLIGTMIFSVASGLSEVFISPIIAALPGATDKDMSGLHALYAVGFVFVAGLSALFLNLVGEAYWQFLTLGFAVLPLITTVLFCLSPFPDLSKKEQPGDKRKSTNRLGLLLCFLCIFIGGATENTMTSWLSSFSKIALNMSPIIGDIVGMSLFAIMLGLGRMLYTKFGKNISIILLGSMILSAVCYLVAGLVPNQVVCFVACILTGLAVSMLWPGTLILMEGNIVGLGVGAYALMAAGGDLGSSLAPQLLGVIIDSVNASQWAENLAAQLSVPIAEIGMRTGMIVGAVFPLIGIGLMFVIIGYFNRQNKAAKDRELSL